MISSGPSRDTATELLRATVRDLTPIDALERAHRNDATAWIDSGLPLYRTAKPATPPKHLVAYSLPIDVDRRAALLIDHRLSGLWLPAGGHLDVDEDPAACAARELGEELNLSAPFLAATGPSPFFVTVTDTVANPRNPGTDELHTDVSLWFAFSGTSRSPVVADEREAITAQWWPFDTITHRPDTRFDPHLPRAIAKLSALLDSDLD